MLQEINIHDVFGIIQKRPIDSNKCDFGRLTVVCGSKYYPGAAALSVLGALRSGTGIVCLASTDRVVNSVSAKINECTYFPLTENEDGCISMLNTPNLIKQVNRGTACLVGCGLTNCGDTSFITERLISEAECTLILDADALNSIADRPEIIKRARKTPIITPHIGEMSRLSGIPAERIKKSPQETAESFSRQYNCVTILKDYKTYIASPYGEVYLSTCGNAGLAKGGSGDVLAGITSSFAAQGIDTFRAGICGVFLHGTAADRCAIRLSRCSMLPSDILFDLCEIFLENNR